MNDVYTAKRNVIPGFNFWKIRYFRWPAIELNKIPSTIFVTKFCGWASYCGRNNFKASKQI